MKKTIEILLVDDDDILRMGYRDLLESEGYIVHSASGGEEALKSIESKSFHLIILDLLMPRPNGFDVYKKLKEQCKTCKLPILILTVVGTDPQIQYMLEDGAFYLAKSKANRELTDKIHQILSSKQNP